MASVFDAFDSGVTETKNKTINDLFDCQKKYAQLIRDYQKEFDYVQDSLRSLREEESNFYKVELPQIIEILKTDDINAEAREIWIKELQKSMRASFQISERLLNDLAVKQMDEFRQAADEILKGGR